jgi:hypothetical protein
MSTAAAERAGAVGGAFVVDNAEITTLNTCQVESWAAFARNRDLTVSTTPACTIDVIKPVEFSAQFQRARGGPAWLTSVTLQAKTILVPTGPMKLGVSGGTTFDLINDRVTQSFVNVPATFEVNEQVRINANIGRLHDHVANFHWLTWGASLEWDFARSVTLVTEVFGQVGRSPFDQRALTDPRLQTGLRFKPTEQVDIDFIYGHNVTGVSTHWVTIGLNVRFGR